MNIKHSLCFLSILCFELLILMRTVKTPLIQVSLKTIVNLIKMMIVELMQILNSITVRQKLIYDFTPLN